MRLLSFPRLDASAPRATSMSIRKLERRRAPRERCARRLVLEQRAALSLRGPRRAGRLDRDAGGRAAADALALIARDRGGHAGRPACDRLQQRGPAVRDDQPAPRMSAARSALRQEHRRAKRSDCCSRAGARRDAAIRQRTDEGRCEPCRRKVPRRAQKSAGRHRRARMSRAPAGYHHHAAAAAAAARRRWPSLPGPSRRAP